MIAFVIYGVIVALGAGQMGLNLGREHPEADNIIQIMTRDY